MYKINCRIYQQLSSLMACVLKLSPCLLVWVWMLLPTSTMAGYIQQQKWGMLSFCFCLYYGHWPPNRQLAMRYNKMFFDKIRTKSVRRNSLIDEFKNIVLWRLFCFVQNKSVFLLTNLPHTNRGLDFYRSFGFGWKYTGVKKYRNN